MSDFLEVTGVAGPSLSAAHRGAFDITGFSFAADSEWDFRFGSPEVGRPEFSAVTVNFADESGLTSFLSKLTLGGTLSHVSLLETGPAGIEALRINLANAMVSSVEHTEQGYALTLGYAEIGVITRTAQKDGSPGPAHSFGYSQVTDSLIAAPPNATAGAASATVAPTKFYLLVDGLTGDSHDSGHEGWFELSEFDVKALTTLGGLAGAGAGGGKPHADPLDLTLDGGGAAITDLLRLIAHGQLIDGVRLEGVTGSFGAPVVTYDLNLAQVALTDVNQDDSGQTHLSLAFGAFKLSANGIDPTGKAGPPTVVSWNFINNNNIVNLPSIAPGQGETGDVSPVNFYLDSPTIHGSSTDTQHLGALRVTGFQFDSSAHSGLQAGGGVQVGKPEFDEITIRFADKAGLGAFMADITTGRHIEDLSLVGTQFDRPGAHEIDTYRLTLKGAAVTSLSDTEDGGYAVTLTYAQFAVTTKPLQADGTAGAPLSFGYDMVRATEIPAPTPIAAPGAPVEAIAPDKYYLLVDGVNGGSTDAGHVGWFELSGHDMETEAQALSGGSTGGGLSPPQATLDLTLASSTGITELLAKMAGSARIAGARIEGVDLGVGPPRAVYDLDLVGVNVATLTQDASGAAGLKLAFGGISLTTAGTDGKGGLVTSDPVTWNFAKNSTAVTVPSIAPGAGGGATQASDFFFEVGGLKGDATEQGLVGAFHVSGFHFAVDAPVAMGSSAPAAGPPDFGPLTLTFANETGLTTFLADLTRGFSIANASLVGVRHAGPASLQEVYRVNLAQMRVTDVHQTTDGGYSLTLAYGEIGVVTQSATASGGFQPQSFGYDIERELAIAPPPNVTPPGGTAPTAPASYYLLVDGVNGGSTDAGHEGWFKISGFDLDASSTVDIGSVGSGIGKAHVGDLSVSLGSTAGITDLLSDLGAGQLITGARIEGVAADGHSSVVYGLDLVDVGVSHLGLGEGRDYQLKLHFGAFKLTTNGLGSDGHATPPQIASWNFETNSSTVEVPPIAPGDGTVPPPPAPTGLGLDAASDTGVAGDHLTKLHTVQVDGAAQAGATVKVLEGTTVLGTGVADANGGFHIAVTLGEGAHNLTATATDASAQTGPASAPFAVTVDSLAPDAPSALALDPASDSGALGDGRTSASQLKIDGHAEAGATVTLYDGQAVVGTGVANGTGQFQITTTGLASGDHVLTAQATDAAGNVSGASAALTVNVNTLALAADAGGHTLAEQPNVTGSAAIDATSASLAFTDNDASATHTAQVGALSFAWSGGELPAAALAGLGSDLLSSSLAETAGTGEVTVALHAPDSAFDFLAAGETLTVSSEVTVTGSTGGSDHQTVAFTVTGANDGPAVGAVLGPNSLSEIAGVSASAAPDVASATLSFTDADLTDHHTVSVAGAPSLVWSGGADVPAVLARAFSGALTASLSEAAGSGEVTATFAAPDAAFDFLAQGETLTLTYDVTVSDSHGASATQPLSFVVSGSNDAPVFQPDRDIHTVVAGQATTDSMLSILTFTDPDWQDQHTAAVGAPQLVWSGGGAVPADLASQLAGAFTVDFDPGGPLLHLLVAHFAAPDSAFGFLAEGETLTIRYPVTVDDGHGGTASEPFVITVIGANDAPSLAADPGPHALAEQAGASGSTAPDTATATLAVTDADLSDLHTLSVAAPSLVWSGGATLPAGLAASLAGALTTSLTESAGTGVVAASFAVADGSFDFLAAGESLTVTYAVTVADDHGASATQPLTFVVAGANDAPVVAPGAVTTATIAERGATLGSTALDQASGAIAIHDPDLNDHLSLTLGATTVVAHAAGGGALALTAPQAAAFIAGFQITPLAAGANDATLNWSYAVEDRALDFLGVGESVTVTTAVQVDDHHGGTLSQPITVTLQGANDAPVATGDLAAVARGASLSVDKGHGVLANDADPDLHDVLQVTAVNGQAVGGAVAGTYGTLTLRADGGYAYVAAKNAALPASGVGQDSFTYQVGDGHGGTATQTLTVTVYATNGVTYVAPTPGQVMVAGGNGKEVLDAGAGGHVLQAGNGADVLLAGFGGDTMTGGNGPDVFVFGHAGFGASVVTDFANGDSLQLDHHLAASFAELRTHATQVGHDVVITLGGGDSIALQGVTLASLRSSDFLFV